MSANEAPADDSLPASDAFGALANEVRTGILEAMAGAEADGRGRMRFSELFEESAAETTAGFSYHLDALVGPYLREVAGEGGSGDGRHGAGYELTHAGREAARAIAAGTYAPRADRDVSIEAPCPHCGDDAVEGRTTAGVLAVSREACDRAVLSLSVPAGLADGGDLSDAFDRHHRHRLFALADGHCPECGGRVEREVVPVDGEDARWDDPPDRVQAAFSCDRCGHRLRAPVTLAVRDHPAVAAFYHDHGRSPDDRPIWNVGGEWAESVLSWNPPCVRVVADLDGDALALYVDGNLEVREVQRTDREVSSPA